MAAATVTISVSDIDSTWMDSKMFHVLGTATIGASPATYSTGGILMDLSHPLIKEQQAPIDVRIESLDGWIYVFIPGVDVTTGLLKIFSAIGTELANNSAIPAGNSGDTLTFEAIFLGMN